MATEKPMIITTISWQGQPTFQLIPTTLDCPYTEAVFVPQGKALIIVSKIKEHRYEMIPKVNDDGHAIKSTKVPNESKKQRVLLETFHEYHILSQREMVNFINLMADNPNGIPFEQIIDVYVNAPTQQPENNMRAMATQPEEKREEESTEKKEQTEPATTE